MPRSCKIFDDKHGEIQMKIEGSGERFTESNKELHDICLRKFKTDSDNHDYTKESPNSCDAI